MYHGMWFFFSLSVATVMDILAPLPLGYCVQLVLQWKWKGKDPLISCIKNLGVGLLDFYGSSTFNFLGDMHAVVLPFCTSVARAGENYTSISPLLFTPVFLLQQTEPLPSSFSALCSFFWFPGYNLTLDVLKNPHGVRIPRDLLLPS